MTCILLGKNGRPPNRIRALLLGQHYSYYSSLFVSYLRCFLHKLQRQIGNGKQENTQPLWNFLRPWSILLLQSLEPGIPFSRAKRQKSICFSWQHKSLGHLPKFHSYKIRSDIDFIYFFISQWEGLCILFFWKECLFSHPLFHILFAFSL